MEPVLKHSGKSKGLEVLYFENAEVQKLKGGLPSFAASGPLSVLYFKDYNRFFLRLNDWIYPIMRRLPIMGLDRTSVHTRSYSLPGPNGSIFNLTLDSFGSDECFENFEAILQDSSKFSWKGKPYAGVLEKSPDDKLARSVKKETGITQVISENFKQGVQTIKNKIQTLKSGTKNINSRKKMLDLKSIKNKNYRKEAKSSFKKDFFESGEKLSKEFLKQRRENLNMTLPKSYKDLISDSQLPALYFWKEELEGTILDYRDICSKGDIDLEKYGQRTELKEAIREGMKEIKDSLGGRRENVAQERSRTQPSGQSDPTKVFTHEVHSHYEG